MNYAIMNNPAAETAGPLKIEYLCSLSFPLVGNPSDSPFVKGVIRGVVLKKDSGQAGMTEIESIVDT